MPKTDWTALNAYVDGELDTATAAAVADAAGSDRATASEIATLYKLKGVSHGAAPEPPVDLRSLLPQQRRIWPGAMAACIAAAMLIGAALWMLAPTVQAPTLPQDLLAEARRLHGDWLAAEARGTADTPPAVLLAALTTFSQVPVIPDLTSTALDIDLVKVAEGPDGRVLQVGYRGNHGCHLSLFAFVDRHMPKAAVRIAAGKDRAYGWRVGDLGYLLFAVGMDEGRLALIAEKVADATRVHAPLDAAAKAQLAENKRHSTTCQA